MNVKSLKAPFLWENKHETLNLHSTLNALLCKCHACFIYKYMYWMYSIYESVGVRWSWHLVVINKWKALPCVSGGESLSPGSSLQANSPEIIHIVYTEYIYIYKRLFLPDLVWSGLVWCCLSTIPDMIPVLHCAIWHPRCCTGSWQWNCDTEEYKIYQTACLTLRDPIQSKWITSFVWISLSQLRDATLNNMSILAEKCCYGLNLVSRSTIKHLAHMKYTLLTNHSLIKKYRPVVHDLNMNNLCINMNKAC